MLGHVGGPSLEGLPFVLDAARQSWPGAFDAGAPGLRDLASPLARCLASLKLLPTGPWLTRVSRDPRSARAARADPRSGFEPDGLAERDLVALTPARQPGPTPGRSARASSDHDLAWKSLSLDVRRDLDEIDPARKPPRSLIAGTASSSRLEARAVLRAVPQFRRAGRPRRASSSGQGSPTSRPCPPCPGGITPGIPNPSVTSATVTPGVVPLAPLTRRSPVPGSRLARR